MGANLPAGARLLSLRTGRFSGNGEMSHHQKTFSVIAGVGPKMLDARVIPVAQIVKAQAVGPGVDQFHQAVLEQGILGGVQPAFKNAVLHPLSVVHTGFGNFAQSFAPGGGLGI